jgi:glycosyltransferase involved in cell wall biosynthesis
MENYAYARAAHAQCGSPEALDVLRRKGFNGPATVLPQFGVDIDQFPFEPKRHGPFTVGYLGRLVPEKGIHDLMAAFASVHPPTRLIIAGDGPLAGFVDAAAADLKRETRFERFPRIPSTDVAALMRRLDVLVLPSRTTRRWREQYGRILIEAMATGVVVVGTDSGEIPNVIGDGGVVVPERDARALGSALNQLADSPDRRAELVSRGRARAVKLFSQAGVAAATFQVYEHILS